MSDCLFCNIANKTIEADVVYDDGTILAFSDINPQAPEHKLIIPYEHIATINDLNDGHAELIGNMTLCAKNLAKELGLAKGYRLVFNCERGAGQEVYHIHLHLLGGRAMTWPPG